MAAINGSVGVLFLHGFTGSPWELAPLADRAQRDGYSVALPALAGHGTCVDDLEATAWNDWLASAHEGLAWLVEHVREVHVVGLSMGALLALLIARRASPPLASLVLLAPALTLRPHQAIAMELAHAVGRPRRLGKKPPDLLAGLLPPAYWQVPVGPTVSLMELMELVRGDHREPACPTLVLHGTRDLTIPRRATHRIVTALLPRAEYGAIRGAGHLLPRTHQGEQVIERVMTFLRHSGRPAC